MNKIKIVSIVPARNKFVTKPTKPEPLLSMLFRIFNVIGQYISRCVNAPAERGLALLTLRHHSHREDARSIT